MSDFKPHHLSVGAEELSGNGGYGRLFFVPGSDGRAKQISQHFEDLQVFPNSRQHNVYTGRLPTDLGGFVDVASVSTGMGCPTLSIVMTELIMLGVRLFIRVGTAGSLQKDTLKTGSLVIATGGVRDEGASSRYIDASYPAVADLDMTAALQRSAHVNGWGANTYCGLVHAKDALYGVEFGHGPLAAENEAFLDRLSQMGVLASDMETSHLFVLSDVHSSEIAPIGRQTLPQGKVKSGAVLAVVGDDTPFAKPERAKAAEEAAIEVALGAAQQLAPLLSTAT